MVRANFPQRGTHAMPVSNENPYGALVRYDSDLNQEEINVATVAMLAILHAGLQGRIPAHDSEEYRLSKERVIEITRHEINLLTQHAAEPLDALAIMKLTERVATIIKHEL